MKVQKTRPKTRQEWYIFLEPLHDDIVKLQLKTMEHDKEFNRADRRFEVIMKYIDTRIIPLEEMVADYYSFKDRVLASLDWLVGAFKKFDEEHTALSENYSRLNNRTENHESRILILEDRRSG